MCAARLLKRALLLLMLLSSQIVLAGGSEIVVTDADAVWSPELTAASTDVTDSTDAPPQGFAEATISHADTVWSPGLTVASSDVTDSTDAPPQTLSEVYVSHADTVWRENLRLLQYGFELSIPSYAPTTQRAPQGTTLTFLVQVENKGSCQDIIELTVFDQSTEDDDWWDVEIASSTIVLDPAESRNVQVKVKIPESADSQFNRVSLKATSLKTGNSDEVVLTAAGLPLDVENVLFGVELRFDASRDLAFEIPSYAEIRENQVMGEVWVAFVPESDRDLDEGGTYIDVRDTVTDASARLSIQFQQKADMVLSTGFAMSDDAYSFSNDVWPSPGRCFGMAATSILYFSGELPFPETSGASTFQLKQAEAEQNIAYYQSWFRFHTLNDVWNNVGGNREFSRAELEKIASLFEEGRPVILLLHGGDKNKGDDPHAVLLYAAIRDDVNDHTYFLTYDVNFSAEKGAKSYAVLKAFPVVDCSNIMDSNGNSDGSCSNTYSTYTQFRIVEAKKDPWYKWIKLFSPGELRVHDSRGRITGLVNGAVREEIPLALYDDEGTVTVYYPSDDYSYEVLGTGEGLYGLTILSAEGGGTTSFAASAIPMSAQSTHRYTVDWRALDLGVKGVTLRMDNDGDGLFEVTITSDGTLQPPVSHTNGPYATNEGSAAILDGSTSYDPDGSIVLYEWDVDADGQYEVSSTSPTMAYAWVDDYAGPLALRVTDDEGLTATADTEVTIHNVAPIVEVGDDATLHEGDAVDGSGAFTDPGADSWDATVDYGDGAGPQPLSLNADKTFGLSHVYADNGTYQVVVTVVDDDGGEGSDSLIVTVDNVSPTASAGSDQTVYRGDVVTLAGTWTDPAEQADAPYTWSWDLDGDSVPDTDGAASYGETIDETVSFGTEGSYELSFSVTDKDGGTHADTVVVQVLNRPPDCSQAMPSIDTIWPANHKFVPIQISGVTDPEGDETTITIDRVFQDEPVDSDGDGSFTPDAVIADDGSSCEVRAERSGSKKVPGDGRVYHITFTADDGHGGTCSGEVTVGVPHDVKDTPVDGGALYDSTLQ